MGSQEAGLGEGRGISIILYRSSLQASVFCSANDLDVELTEIWGESKNDSKGEVDGSK